MRTDEERAARKANIARLERKHRIKALEAKGSKMPKARGNKPDTATAKNRVRAGLQGMTMGWSDEIGAGVAAGAVKAGNWLTGAEPDKGYTEIYREMHDSLQDEREQYQKDNFGEALAFEIGGGLLTGGIGAGKVAATKVGQKVLSKIPAINKATKVGKVLDAATTGKTGKLLGATGAGITEGAIAGAGAAKEGETLSGAGKGALFGGVLSPTITGGVMGAKGLVKAATNRNVKKTLAQSDGRQVPINLADDGRLGDFYRDKIGLVNGSIGRQTKEFTDEADQAVADATTLRDKALSDAETMGANEHSRLDAEMTHKTNQMADARTAASNTIKDGAERGRVEGRQVTDNAIADGERQYRNNVIRESVPNRLTIEETEALTRMPLDQARAKVREMWSGPEAFAEVKMKDYDVYVPAMQHELADVFARNERITPYWDTVKAALGKRMGEKLEGADKGVINGDALMAVRNDLREMASSMMGNPRDGVPADAQAFNSAAKYLDSFIKRHLSDNEIARYEGDLKNYGNSRSLDEAMVGASSPEQQMKFTPEQWVQVQARKRFDDTASGEAVMQDEAYKFNDWKNKLNADLDATDAASGKRNRNAEQQQQADFTRSKAALVKTTKAMKDQAKLDATAGTKVDEKQAGLAKSVAEAKAMKTRAPREGVTPVGVMVNLGAISAPIAALFGLPWMGGVALAGGLTKATGTKAGQRVIAGQTRAQRKVALAIKQRQKAIAEGKPYQGEIPEKMLITIMSAMRRQSEMSLGEQ